MSTSISLADMPPRDMVASRARARRRYLVDRGVADNRLETVSFGEEQPAATGSDEGAWSQNRRAEFEILAGGNMLVAPRM